MTLPYARGANFHAFHDTLSLESKKNRCEKNSAGYRRLFIDRINRQI